MDSKEQLISDLSDLNQLLTEELYLWTMRDKNPNFDEQNILNLGRAIHEKTLLISYAPDEKPVQIGEETKTFIHFEIEEVQQLDENSGDNRILQKVEIATPVRQEMESLVLEPLTINNEEVVFKMPETVKSDVPLGDLMMQKGIDNLNSVIGISEKFLFIHELFKGDTEKYMAELSKLNDFNSTELAHAYFAKLSQDLDWDLKSPAYLELHKILLRKYQK